MDLNKHNFFDSKKYILITAIIFLCYFICLIILINIFYDQFVNSDRSSELLLAKQIMDEGRFIFSKQWYYSTEIRVIHNHLIYGIMFRITSNYRIVYSVSQFIILIILLLCFFILCKSLNLEKHFFILSILLITPWSISSYNDIVVISQYYAPSLCFSFVIIALLFFSLKTNNNKKYILLITVGIILSFLYSLAGGRAIVCLTAPLFLITFLFFIKSKNKKNLIYGSSIFIASLIAFLVNMLYLKKAFNLETNYYKFNLNFNKLGNIILVALSSLGSPLLNYVNGLEIFIFILILFFLSTYIYLLIKNKNNLNLNILFISIFSLTAFMCVFFSELCFSTEITNRYYIPATIFLIILLPDYFCLLFKLNFKPIHKKIYSYTIGLCFITLSIISYVQVRNNPLNTKTDYNSLIIVNDYLIENNLKKGYSSFWNANVLTEVSNGEIEIYHFVDYKEEEGLTMYKWLQTKSHDNFKIEGKTFILFGNDKEKENKLLYEKSLNLATEKITFGNSRYEVFLYDDISPLFKN